MGLIATLRGPADTVAIGGILAAVFDKLPTILGVIAGVMGVVWYCVLFYDRFIKKYDSEYQPPPADKEPT